MIWDSIALMTIIDLLIIGLVSVFTLHLQKKPDTSTWGKRLILMGVGCIALFYTADLMTMWLLPVFTSTETAMTNMQALHLEGSWVVSLVSVPCLIAGFSKMQQSMERQTRQTAAAISEQRELIAALPGGLLILNDNDEIVEINDQGETIFAAAKHALIGTAVGDLFHDQVPNTPLKNGRLGAITCEGKRFPAEINVTELLHNRRLVFIRNITETIGLEAQLRQAQKMESLGRLAGGIAHDFNNYLTVVIGETGLMEPGEPASATAIAHIREAAERAAELTNQLLSFGRKQLLDTRVLDLNHEITELNGLLRNLLGKQITLTTVHDSLLTHVRVDAAQFEQIVVNIAINARDAMPDGGKLTIETANVFLDQSFHESNPDVEVGEYALITISDTGTGISPEVMEHIFEPFYTTKPRGRGTGLGLAMVMGFVMQSKGTISVESTPNAGTTFRIYLPAVDEELALADNTPPAISHPEYDGNERIVVAEDDQAVRNFVEKALLKSGYRVSCYANAKDAFGALDQNVDLLLTDIIMPNGSGFDLADRALERFPCLPVLYMTGFVEQSFVESGEFVANEDTLRKPFSVLELLRAVRNSLSGSQTN